MAGRNWLVEESAAVASTATDVSRRKRIVRIACELGPCGGSDTQKDLPPVHPEEQQPHHEQHQRTVDQRLVRLAENLCYAFAKVDVEAAADETVEQVRDAIGGDGVHADHQIEEE